MDFHSILQILQEFPTEHHPNILLQTLGDKLFLGHLDELLTYQRHNQQNLSYKKADVEEVL